MQKKIIFIPGWMYSPKYFKLGSGLDVWKGDFDFTQPVAADYLIGHSMGAAAALKLWNYYQNKQLILVNPFIDQKSFFETALKWIKFHSQEKIKTEGLLNFRFLPKNLKKAWDFPDINYWEILKDIPKEKVIILHGSKDYFLCGKETCNKIKSFGFEIVEISEAGHDWHPNFENEIEKMINN